MEDQSDIAGAISAYVQAVKDESFPGREHCF
jgi:ketopantoate hydroxymethyltransferase